MTQEYPSLDYMLKECDKCHYISSHLAFDNPHVPCPGCGQQGSRIMFPDLSPAALFDAAIHFRDIVEERYHARLGGMVDRVNTQTGRRYEPAELLDVSDSIRQVYNSAGSSAWTDETWQRMVGVTAGKLALSAAEATQVCAIIATTSFDLEELTAMVILGCAFLESMMVRFLIRVAERAGMNDDDATEQVETHGGFDKTGKKKGSIPWLFSKHTGGLSLAQEFAKRGYADFWSEWECARDDRNDIVHGRMPFAPADSRMRVARLLTQAIPLFVELQNRYGVLTPSGS